MKNLLLLSTAAFMLSGCAAAVVPAKIVTGVYAGYAADIAINTARGGTAGKTISGDTARAAINGSETAKGLCAGFEGVSLVDPILLNPFTTLPILHDIGAVTHCDRWALVEAGEHTRLKAIKRNGGDYVQAYCDGDVEIIGKDKFCEDK